MANNYSRDDIQLKMCGREFTLRPTFEAMAEIEDLTKRNVYEVIGEMFQGKGFSFSFISAAFYAGIKAGWPRVSIEKPPTRQEVGAMVQDEGIMELSPILGEFIAAGTASSTTLRKSKAEAAKAEAAGKKETAPQESQTSTS